MCEGRGLCNWGMLHIQCAYRYQDWHTRFVKVNWGESMSDKKNAIDEGMRTFGGFSEILMLLWFFSFLILYFANQGVWGKNTWT